MALTLRRNKSLPLTHDELDDNFEYLSSSIASGGGTNLTVSGSFAAERVIISGNTSSAAPGGLATSENIRVWVDNGGFAIGGSQGLNGVQGVGLVISEDPSNGNHVILSDGSGSDLRLRAGGAEAGDSYIHLLSDQAGFSESDIFTIAKFGGPLRGTELYHTGSLVFNTTEIGANKAVVVTGTISASAEVYFSGLANTTTPNIVGFDIDTGKLSYYSTGSFGGGSTDYVSNVTLNGTDLEFTGVGSAFNSTVSLSSLSGGGSDITALNNFTGSAQTSITALNAATGSYLYSGSFATSSGVLTLYSPDTNYAIDLSSLSTGGATPTLDAVTTAGNTTNNTINVGRVNASIGAFSTQVTSSQIGVNSDNTNARFEVGGDSWQAGRVHFPKLKTVTSNLKFLAIQTGSLGGFGEVTALDFSHFVSSSSTGSFLYSGSYSSATSTITLYSPNQNYTLDLSGLAGGGGGFPITASDEGSDLTNSMSKIDFVGNAVTATNVGSIVTVTINTGSAASATDITALNNFTGSAQISLNSLEAATGSYVYSGSFDGSTTLTLYSADTNYSLDLSALAGGSTDITALNNFTGSAQISLDALNAATASYVTNDQTSSFLDNIYTTDGTLSGARTVTQDGNGLTFNGQGAFNTFDISSGGRFTISGSTNVKIDGLQSGTQANVLGIDSQGLLYVQATSSIAGGGGSGTVTSVTVSGSNGVSGSGTITSSGTIVLQHADTSAQGSVNNSGNTFIQDITLDGFGHVTGISSSVVGATQVNSSAIYAESTTGFNVHSYPNYEVVNINATNIEANAPKTVGGDTNRLLAIATMEVGNPAVSLQNCVFNYELYNSTQTLTVAGSQGAFSAYLLPGGEGAPNTTFTFTLPINDTNVNDGDTIQLRAKAYAVGAYATASIYYASLTLLDME